MRRSGAENSYRGDAKKSDFQVGIRNVIIISLLEDTNSNDVPLI
jgi:hypothetical protein